MFAEVVFSKSIFHNTKIPEVEPQSNIVSVAKQLREDIISHGNTVPEHKWPPTFESVTAEFGDPPDSVKLFLNNLQQRRAEQTERKHVASLIQLCQISFVTWRVA